jgi:hypothetical protein
MSVQVNGDPAATVPVTIQTPKAIIPADIRNESVASMFGPFPPSATTARQLRIAEPLAPVLWF